MVVIPVHRQLPAEGALLVAERMCESQVHLVRLLGAQLGKEHEEIELSEIGRSVGLFVEGAEGGALPDFVHH